MPKAYPDYIKPETSRKVKGMSLPQLSDYLWKIYSAGYSAGLLDCLRGSDPDREYAQQPEAATNDE